MPIGSSNTQVNLRPIHTIVQDSLQGALNELNNNRNQLVELYKGDYGGLLRVLQELKQKGEGLERLVVSDSGWELLDPSPAKPVVAKNGGAKRDVIETVVNEIAVAETS